MELTEREVVDILRDFISGQFPRTCPHCHRRFETLKEYLQTTTHVGDPVSFDADLGNWEPALPIGTLSLANCPCGNTLAVGTETMSLKLMWKLMRWAKKETARRGISASELLSQLRREIDQLELGGGGTR